MVLNVLGFPWPDMDEGQLREAPAALVRLQVTIHGEDTVVTSAGAGGLPDADVLERVALDLVAGAPTGWTELRLLLWYEADDVFNTRAFVTGAGRATQQVRPPHSDLELDDMRSRQKASGQEPWNRVDLVVTRAAGSDDPEFTADFAYEVGDIPGQEQ